MLELDEVTINMALASYLSYKPRYYIWCLARKCKRETKNKDIKRFMNMVLKDVTPVALVREMSNGVMK